MKIITLFLSLTFCNLLHAQKVEVKDNIISVNDKPFAKIERTGGAFSQDIYFEIKNAATGKSLMRISILSITMPEKVSSSNPKGNVIYMKFNFFDSARHFCEVDDYYFKLDKMAKYLIKNNLLTETGLNEEEVLNFIAVKGTPFSDRNTIKVKF